MLFEQRNMACENYGVWAGMCILSINWYTEAKVLVEWSKTRRVDVGANRSSISCLIKLSIQLVSKTLH